MASGAAAGSTGCYHGGMTGSNNAFPDIQCFQWRLGATRRDLSLVERLATPDAARRASTLWPGRRPTFDCRLACNGLYVVDAVRSPDDVPSPPIVGKRTYVGARQSVRGCGACPAPAARATRRHHLDDDDSLLPRPSFRERYRREQRRIACQRCATRRVARPGAGVRK